MFITIYFFRKFLGTIGSLKDEKLVCGHKKITDGMNGITHRVKNITLLFLAFAFLEKIVSFR